jgi:hypothetical protein
MDVRAPALGVLARASALCSMRFGAAARTCARAKDSPTIRFPRPRVLLCQARFYLLAMRLVSLQLLECALHQLFQFLRLELRLLRTLFAEPDTSTARCIRSRAVTSWRLSPAFGWKHFSLPSVGTVRNANTSSNRAKILSRLLPQGRPSPDIAHEQALCVPGPAQMRVA